MNLPVKQAHVLQNLHRRQFRQSARKWRPFLDNENCHYPLVCLAVKQLITWDRETQPVRVEYAEKPQRQDGLSDGFTIEKCSER